MSKTTVGPKVDSDAENGRTITVAPESRPAPRSARLARVLEEAEADVNALDAQVTPLRERYTQLREQIEPQLAEIAQLQEKITQLENPEGEPSLRDRKQELAILRRALSPTPTHTLKAEPTHVNTEAQK